MILRDLIEGSFRLIGVLASGESLDAAQGQDGLEVYSGILESWSTDNLLIAAQKRLSFNVTSGTSSYILDNGTAIPEFIDRIALLKTESGQTIEYPVSLVTFDQYSLLSNRSFQGQYPNAVWVKKSDLETHLNFYPVPSVNIAIAVYFKTSFVPPTGLDDVLAFQKGVTRALKYELARELAIEYGKPADGRIEKMADQLKRNLRAYNAQELKSISDIYDLTGVQPYNIWDRS